MDYHIDDSVLNDEARKLFQFFEEQHPYPASVTPNIPTDARQQLGTIDKLAQSVVPRMVDKLNDANWKIERLTALCVQQQAALDDLYKWINETALPTMQTLQDNAFALRDAAGKKKAATKPRKSKKATPVDTVDITEIADYDPDNDSWGPMVIDGHQITGALLDTVAHLSGAASQMYSDELIDFINNLDDNVKVAIAEKFPR